MEPERLDGFLHGFVAGYREAIPEGLDARNNAVNAATDALVRKRHGACINCGRSGVVILDGYNCERCSPGLAEVQREIRGDEEEVPEYEGQVAGIDLSDGPDLEDDA